MSLPLFELRPWRAADLPHLLHHANNPRIAANMRDAFPHPYTEADGLDFLARATGPLRQQLRAIALPGPNADTPGEAIGSIGYFPDNDVARIGAEIGYWLAQPYWGRGIMPAAVRQFAAWVFAQRPDLVRLHAHAFGRNLASHQVLRKAGFNYRGTFPNSIIKNGLLDSLVHFDLHNLQHPLLQRAQAELPSGA